MKTKPIKLKVAISQSKPMRVKRSTGAKIGLLALLFVFGFALSPVELLGEDVPAYRGKIILIIDKTMATNTLVSPKLDRLVDDLVGDGWRVLRHDVERGPKTPFYSTPAAATNWWHENVSRVRQVRSIIKGDYDAAPNEVKSVLLIGHVPVPYSGLNGQASGGHYGGAMPSDGVYAELTSLDVGLTGWTDTKTATNVTDGSSVYWYQNINLPNDGKPDQDFALAQYSVALGRIDLSDMYEFDADPDGISLMSRYLNKNHDFRSAELQVSERAITAGNLVISPMVFSNSFATIEAHNNAKPSFNWFPFVMTNGRDFIYGYAGGFGTPRSSETIGYSVPQTSGPDIAISSTNNFVTNDSRVVFLQMYGSYFGNWEEPSDFLRAPLANEYDPANGRHGYGLATLWGEWLVESNMLVQQMTGATFGNATKDALNRISSRVSTSIMGDPTLRLHPLLPPTNFTAVTVGSNVMLSWAASAAASEGYNVFVAPTRNGPFTLLNTTGPLSATNYTAMRSVAESAPDNYYMVRAVKTMMRLPGVYTNMSEGSITPAPGSAVGYLNIASSPAGQVLWPNEVSVFKMLGLGVDASGIDTSGDMQLFYQWWKDGVPLSDGGNLMGVQAASLLLTNLQASVAGNYFVTVSNSMGVVTSAVAVVEARTNHAPVISTIPPQSMDPDTVLDVPFTVTDDYTSVELLTYSVVSSNASIIPISKLNIIGAGSNKTLRINLEGTHLYNVASIITVTFTDLFGASNAVSFNVMVGAFTNLTFVSEAMVSNGFQMVLFGTNGTSYQLLSSQDLSTWQVMPGGTISGAMATNLDTTIGGTDYRFYRAVTPYGCAANSIGFVKQLLDGNSNYKMLANQLNNYLGNDVSNLYLTLPSQSKVTTYSTDSSYTTGTKKGTGAWSLNSTVNPGMGYLACAGGSNQVQLTLFGDVLSGSLTNINIGIHAGESSFLSSMLPKAGTLDALGFPAIAGDKILKWDLPLQTWLTNAVYDGTNWDPAVPSIGVGEGFFLWSGTTPTNRVWCQSAPGCVPMVTLTAPANGNSYYLGMPVYLSATANGGAGVSNVSFYEGSTPIGLGTLVSGEYYYTWTNPTVGSYSLTARTMANDGQVTISIPASITVYPLPAISSGSMSGTNFQFDVSGGTGGSLDLLASTNLETWTTLGSVTPPNTYVDPAAGSYSNRFYRVREAGYCSDIIGYVQTTVPNSNYIALANQLNVPAGNLTSNLFPTLPSQSKVLIYSSGFGYTTGTKKAVSSWNTNFMLNPGMGFFAYAGGTSSVPVTFVGGIAAGTLANVNIPTNAGVFSLLGSMLPKAGTLDALGFPAIAGDKILKWDLPLQTWLTNAVYDGTNWDPAVPSIGVGEGFFLWSGTTPTNRVWYQSAPACP